VTVADRLTPEEEFECKKTDAVSQRSCVTTSGGGHEPIPGQEIDGIGAVLAVDPAFRPPPLLELTGACRGFASDLVCGSGSSYVPRRRMRGALTKDRVAVLYKKFGPAIYTRCRRILKDAAAAEDATQEVFLRVGRSLDEAPGSPEALAWIYRIATNYCLNELRSRKRRARVVTSLPEATVGHDGENAVANRELARRIIQRAPGRLAESAYLYHVDGMSHEEVASVLGHSRRTVINHIAEFGRRARKFLLRTQ